ncbi:MAG: HAMP domain-containing sensor histidine kinase [Anaerovorax sp.]
MFLFPQYSMMSATSTSLLFGLVFLFLSKQINRHYMTLWGFCWLLYSLMFFLDFVNFTDICLWISYVSLRQCVALLGSLLFLLATYDFFRLKPPSFVFYTSGISLISIIFSDLSGNLFWLITIPNGLYSSLLLVFAGCMFISYSWTQNLPEKIIVSFLIILWSIFLNNFGFTLNYQSLGIYNYFMGILLVNLLVIFILILHFKKLTFLIEKHEDSLQAAESSRKELIENISHEIRTPMTLIQGYAESLLNDIVPHSATNTYLRMIQSKAVVVTTLLEDLIQASHVTSQTMEFKFYEINIFDFIIDALDQAEFQIQNANITFKCENWVDKYAISIVDPTRLQQVITNLINNSIRHTPMGGEISIVCSSIPTSMRTLTNASKDELMSIPDGLVFFSVIDSGDGIDPDDLPHIFERKFSGKNALSKKSTSGLGLFISNEIIKQHSGRIWAENNCESGAKISFSIPYYLSES